MIAFDGQNIRSTQLLKKQQDEEGPLRRETGFNVVSLTSKNEKMHAPDAKFATNFKLVL